MAEDIQKDQEEFEEASLTDLEEVSGGHVCISGSVQNSEGPTTEES